MARQKRSDEDKKEELDEDSRRRKKVQQPLYDQLKERDEEKAGLDMNASIQNHADFLMEAGNDEERSSLAAELQQSYGNAYMQQLVERIQAKKGAGRPLEHDTRMEMENALGGELKNVRIHTDSKSDELADELGAVAFTAGKDIFFKNGTYQPYSKAGKKLLGHELAHVVQQGNKLEPPSRITDPAESAEMEAGAAAEALSQGKFIPAQTKPEMTGTIARVWGVEIGQATKAPSKAEPEVTPTPQQLRIWNRLVQQPLEEIDKLITAKPPKYEKAEEQIWEIKKTIQVLEAVFNMKDNILSNAVLLENNLLDVLTAIDGASDPLGVVGWLSGVKSAALPISIWPILQAKEEE